MTIEWIAGLPALFLSLFISVEKLSWKNYRYCARFYPSQIRAV